MDILVNNLIDIDYTSALLYTSEIDLANYMPLPRRDTQTISTCRFVHMLFLGVKELRWTESTK